MPMLSYKAGRATRRSEDSNWVDPSPEKGTLEFELMDDLAQLGVYTFKASSRVHRLTRLQVWTSREPGSATERECVESFGEGSRR